MQILKLSMLSSALFVALIASGCTADANPERTAASNHVTSTYNKQYAECVSLAGNFKDICVAEAKGRADVANAELEVRFEPSDESQLKLRIARADAVFAVANERCDDFAGNAKSVCQKEAEQEHVASKSDALLDDATAAANAAARKQMIQANAAAARETEKAAQQAANDNHAAAYAVDREKCNAFADETKDTCIEEAKARHGQG